MLRDRLIVGCLSFSFLLIGLLFYRPLHGFRVQVILSGSMKPALQTGSLVLVQERKPWEYKVGDIVSFRPPTAKAVTVTHRIIDLRLHNGVPIMHTKGDANSSGDPWESSLGSITGKTLISIPWLGYPIAWLQHPVGFIALAVCTFCLCIVPELIELWQCLQKSSNQLVPEG